MRDDGLIPELAVAVFVIIFFLVIFYGMDLIRDILNWVVQYCPVLFFLFIIILVIIFVNSHPHVGILRRLTGGQL